MRWIALAVLTLGCGPGEPPASPACSEGTWGASAYDALDDGLRDPDLFDRDAESLSAFRERLERAAAVAPPASMPARLTLQNDVWGVWQRARAPAASSPIQRAIERAAARLVRRLAPAAVADPWRPGLPAPIASALGSGWHERESELPSLQHERLFGLRRVFHVARRGEHERALFSTLVALDARGRPHVTRLVGELEVLRFEGATLAAAQVYELDRRAVRCRGPEHALRPLERVEHVPGTGAHGFLATFDPPAALEALPCAQCHEDDAMMSLPSESLAVGSRFEALLAPARTEGAAIAMPDERE